MAAGCGMTTERIDVLAILARLDGDMCLPDLGEIAAARAAVAELIEAVRGLRTTFPTYSIAYGQAEQRLDAALARVGAA